MNLEHDFFYVPTTNSAAAKKTRVPSRRAESRGDTEDHYDEELGVSYFYLSLTSWFYYHLWSFTPIYAFPNPSGTIRRTNRETSRTKMVGEDKFHRDSFVLANL